ncbi:MAG: hypothetical protein ACLQFF_02305 [Steroidobacteraceae bacterium]|jgi:hypothetical protein
MTSIRLGSNASTGKTVPILSPIGIAAPRRLEQQRLWVWIKRAYEEIDRIGS